MAWQVTSDPAKFDEAVNWFRSRFPVTKELLEALAGWAGPRAWTVAGIAQLDMVLMVFKEIDSAIADGRTLSEFKKTTRSKLGEAWGKGTAFRLETIFRTNVQTAYNRGRWVQMRDPEVLKVRPFWMFDAILDARITKEICKPRNKTVLPADDPWWNANVPPLHHRCRSSIRSLRKRQAERRGVSSGPPEGAEAPTHGFGKSPTEKEWTPEGGAYPTELWDAFQTKKRAREQQEAK